MKASTHTEVYRPFKGQMKDHPMRWLTIAGSAVRHGFKRKMPALLLFSPIAIGCIIFCFRVHFMFSLTSGEILPIDNPGAQIATQSIANVLGDVVTNIFLYLQGTSFFALLVITWYGAGLIAEDRRLGANLLYFSRPLSRLDYLLGKGAGAAAFGALALMVPCLVICFVASFSSPDWSFLTDEWTSILKIVLFSAAWVATLSLLVLTVSSLVSRKSYALIGMIGVVVLTGGVSKAVARILDENAFSLLSLFDNFSRVGEWLFDRWEPRREVTIEATFLALAGLWALCLFILTTRIRKLEVVA